MVKEELINRDIPFDKFTSWNYYNDSDSSDYHKHSKFRTFYKKLKMENTPTFVKVLFYILATLLMVSKIVTEHNRKVYPIMPQTTIQAPSTLPKQPSYLPRMPKLPE